MNMIKRDITETVYEYDKEGKLVRKTVTETHEEESNVTTYQPGFTYLNDVNPYDVNPYTLNVPCTPNVHDGATCSTQTTIHN